MRELNNVFLDRMKGILGDKYDDFMQSMDRPNEKAVYVNENKISVDEFRSIADFSIEPIGYERAGFYIGEQRLGRHPLHHAGAIYVQEPSAMFTVNALKFRGDERVLDLCSAPGGKSIQIANRIPNGILVSNEIVKSRSEIMYSNIERMGLRNVVITNDSPDNVCRAYANCFDVCLVDAPCSGEGMFRKGSDMISAWNENLNAMCAVRQLEILECADMALKTGGYLIYSTCTYSEEENEEVVKKFVSTHGYELINIDADFSRGIGLEETVRLYPHEVRGEGQYVALMRKISENDNTPTRAMKLKNSSFAKKFVLDAGLDLKNVVEYGAFAYNVIDCDMIKYGVNYLSIGVRLGQVESGRLEPYHYLFTAFGSQMRNVWNLDHRDDRVNRYLRGETFDVDLPEGYGAIIVNNCALGGYKISKGKFKNFYPKGLRNF